MLHVSIRSAAGVCTLLTLTGLLFSSNPAGAVVGGEVDPNVPESPWGGVGSVRVGKGVYTGALIAPSLVLTAAHAIGRANPASIMFTLNLGSGPETTLRAETVFVHPGFRGFRGFLHGSEFDLALIRLHDPAPAGTPVYRIADLPLRQGAMITLVGYGASGTGDEGVTADAGAHVKRVGQNIADCFAFVPFPGNCGLPMLAGTGMPVLYLFDFDSPDGAVGVFGGPPPPGVKEATLGGGDSGSPAFVRTSQGWEIVAVNTFVTRAGPDGQLGVFGTVGGGVLLTDDVRRWVEGIATGQSWHGIQVELALWCALGLATLVWVVRGLLLFRDPQV